MNYYKVRITDHSSKLNDLFLTDIKADKILSVEEVGETNNFHVHMLVSSPLSITTVKKHFRTHYPNHYGNKALYSIVPLVFEGSESWYLTPYTSYLYKTDELVAVSGFSESECQEIFKYVTEHPYKYTEKKKKSKADFKHLLEYCKSNHFKEFKDIAPVVINYYRHKSTSYNIIRTKVFSIWLSLNPMGPSGCYKKLMEDFRDFSDSVRPLLDDDISSYII